MIYRFFLPLILTTLLTEAPLFLSAMEAPSTIDKVEPDEKELSPFIEWVKEHHVTATDRNPDEVDIDDVTIIEDASLLSKLTKDNLTQLRNSINQYCKTPKSYLGAQTNDPDLFFNNLMKSKQRFLEGKTEIFFFTIFKPSADTDSEESWLKPFFAIAFTADPRNSNDILIKRIYDNTNQSEEIRQKIEHCIFKIGYFLSNKNYPISKPSDLKEKNYNSATNHSK